MARLESVNEDDLRKALDEVERKRPAQRLMAAIAYVNGVTQTELADWFGVERKTIYNWLTRLETDEPLAEAARDRDRPGRRRKLTDEQLKRVVDAIQRSPADSGYDAVEWTPGLVQEFVSEEFDIGYSEASCRRLLSMSPGGEINE